MQDAVPLHGWLRCRVEPHHRGHQVQPQQAKQHPALPKARDWVAAKGSIGLQGKQGVVSEMYVLDMYMWQE